MIWYFLYQKVNFAQIHSSDSSMFLNMKLYNKMNQNDILAIDGGYTLFITQFIELANKKGYYFRVYFTNNHPKSKIVSILSF